MRRYRQIVGTAIAAAGGGGSGPTTTFSFVDSTALPRDTFHLRRALVGGSLSRAWVSWEREGQRYVVSFRHEGSGANPVTWEPSVLTGATHAYCDLASGTRTAAQVASAFAVTAAGLDGGTWNALGADASSSGASAPLLSLDMDEDGQATRGKWGMQRDMATPDAYDGSTSNGNMGATGGTHLTSPGAGRVLGLYIRSDGGGDIRLGLGNGATYAADPGAITILGQGVATAVDNNALGVVLFAEPIAITALDSLWILMRALNTQLLRFRDVDDRFGDLTLNEDLIWSALTGDPTVAFGATVDIGGGGGPFQLYAHVGIIYELPSAGRYRNNAIRMWVGYQGAATAGTFDVTDPTDMSDEILSFRAAIPASLRPGSVTRVRQGVGARTAGDDLGLAFHSWTAADVTNFPSVSGATLLQSVGAFGVSAANAYNTHVLVTPVPLAGVETLGVSVNCGRPGGTPATTLQFLYNEDQGGLPSLNHWGDDGRAWSDWIDETGYRVNTEYQARASSGSTMPAGDPTLAWPATWEVDDNDTAPLNAPRMAFLVVLPGITAVES